MAANTSPQVAETDRLNARPDEESLAMYDNPTGDFASKVTGNGDSSDEAIGQAREFRKIRLLKACRPSVMLMGVVPAMLGLVVFGAVQHEWGRVGGRRAGTTSRPGAPVPVHATPVRNLMQSPQMVGLIVEQVYDIHGRDTEGRTQEDYRPAVGHVLTELGSLLDSQLDHRQKLSLRDANFDNGTWHDLRTVLRNIRNGTVVGLGRHVFEVIANSSSTEGDIQRLLRDDLGPQADMLKRLRRELVPDRFAHGQDDRSLDIWKGLLSTQAMQEMRRTDAGQTSQAMQQSSVEPHEVSQDELATHVGYLKHRVHSGGAPQSMPEPMKQMLRRLGVGTPTPTPAVERRLAAAPPAAAAAPTPAPVPPDTWLTPQLNGVELSVSIAAVVLSLALEVVVHCAIMIKGFSMPLWAWLMLICPTNTTVVAACLAGLSLWCDIIFGSLAFNLLELMALPFFAIGGGGSSQESYTPYNPLPYDPYASVR